MKKEEISTKKINTLIITRLGILGHKQNILGKLNTLNKALNNVGCSIIISEDRGGFGYVWKLNKHTEYTIDNLKEKAISKW